MFSFLKSTRLYLVTGVATSQWNRRHFKMDSSWSSPQIFFLWENWLWQTPQSWSGLFLGFNNNNKRYSVIIFLKRHLDYIIRVLLNLIFLVWVCSLCLRSGTNGFTRNFAVGHEKRFHAIPNVHDGKDQQGNAGREFAHRRKSKLPNDVHRWHDGSLNEANVLQARYVTAATIWN